MKRQTRNLVFKIAAGVAFATAAAVVLIPAAQAAPGQVTGNVNVRSGPGTGFRVVDTLPRGTAVDVGQCQSSFCQVRTRNTSGWVSASFLSTGSSRPGPGPSRPGNPVQPGLGFGFSVGPNGPSINFGVGNQQPNQPRPPVVNPPSYGEVCLYERSNYRGQSVCLKQGERIRDLGNFAERVSSIDNPDGLRVEVCGDFYGDCRTYSTSAASLGDFDDFIVSVRVR